MKAQPRPFFDTRWRIDWLVEVWSDIFFILKIMYCFFKKLSALIQPAKADEVAKATESVHGSEDGRTSFEGGLDRAPSLGQQGIQFCFVLDGGTRE